MHLIARAGLGSVLWVLALPTGADLSQVQQNDPNAANASLARQSDMRALQQQRTTDFNTLTMQAQRNVQYRPDEPYYHGFGGLRRGDGRPGRARARSGFNTGVCIGC